MFKYPSMIGEAHLDAIEYLKNDPELSDSSYVVTEKLDGSNFSLRVSNQGVSLFSRNQDITNVEFNSIHRLLFPVLREPWFLDLVSFLEIFKESEYILFGEVYGSGINKRVYCGPDKYIRFFDILNVFEGKGIFLPYEKLTTIIPENRRVPELADNLSLEEALSFPLGKDSVLTPIGYDKPNLAEGVVIRPAHRKDKLVERIRPMIKLRNPSFLEGSISLVVEDMTDEELLIVDLNNQFKGLINENRVTNLLSKYPELVKTTGEIDTGKGIGLLLSDAKEDFYKSIRPSLKGLGASQLKRVYNAGGLPYQLLKNTTLPPSHD
jgi:Rnl2 family RNA ligase